MDFLKDTKDITNLNALMNPYLLREIYENLEQSKGLSNFLKNFSEYDSWIIVSDYCIGDPNKKDIMTFILFPALSLDGLKKVSNLIKKLQPKDMKHSRNINLDFLNFISDNPFFNISYILDSKRNLVKNIDQEKNYFKDRLQSIEKFYVRLAEMNNKNPNNIPYYKDIRRFSNKLNSKNLSLKTLRDIDLVSHIISSIFTLVSKKYSHHKEMMFAWVSDKDKLLTYERKNLSDALIFNIIFSTFYSHNNHSRKLINHDVTKNSEFDFDNFNRIADVIAGALADIKPENIVQDKVLQTFENFIFNTHKNHITKIHYSNNLLSLTPIIIQRI